MIPGPLAESIEESRRGDWPKSTHEGLAEFPARHRTARSPLSLRLDCARLLPASPAPLTVAHGEQEVVAERGPAVQGRPRRTRSCLAMREGSTSARVARVIQAVRWRRWASILGLDCGLRMTAWAFRIQRPRNTSWINPQTAPGTKRNATSASQPNSGPVTSHPKWQTSGNGAANNLSRPPEILRVLHSSNWEPAGLQRACEFSGTPCLGRSLD